MRFFYHIDAGKDILCFDDIAHFRSRRQRVGDLVCLVNFIDKMLYEYEIEQLERHKAVLCLKSSADFDIVRARGIVGLCVIDTKEILEILPFLNELNVAKLLLVYSDYSQKNYKIDEKFLAKARKILINSSEQCGRYGTMQIEVFDSIKSLLKAYSDVVLVDFGADSDIGGDGVYLIGPEGGFSKAERALDLRSARLNQPNVLKAKTAVCFVASKLF